MKKLRKIVVLVKILEGYLFFFADSESTPQITYLTSIRKNLKRVLLRKVHLNVNAAVITRARTLQVRIPSHAKLFCPPPFVFLNHSEMFARYEESKFHHRRLNKVTKRCEGITCEGTGKRKGRRPLRARECRRRKRHRLPIDDTRASRRPPRRR